MYAALVKSSKSRRRRGRLHVGCKGNSRAKKGRKLINSPQTKIQFNIHLFLYFYTMCSELPRCFSLDLGSQIKSFARRFPVRDTGRRGRILAFPFASEVCFFCKVSTIRKPSRHPKSETRLTIRYLTYPKYICFRMY